MSPEEIKALRDRMMRKAIYIGAPCATHPNRIEGARIVAELPCAECSESSAARAQGGEYERQGAYFEIRGTEPFADAPPPERQPAWRIVSGATPSVCPLDRSAFLRRMAARTARNVGTPP